MGLNWQLPDFEARTSMFLSLTCLLSPWPDNNRLIDCYSGKWTKGTSFFYVKMDSDLVGYKRKTLCSLS